MNIVIWAFAGGILGWAGYAFLGYNEGRGKVIPIIIGAVGGVLGGEIIAPMFTAGTVVAVGGFNSASLLYASVVAAVFLAVGNVVYNKWGV
jgi:uncharacterized membrane protein YeaQ/YmgE (transglycosylase-associated protein family)